MDEQKSSITALITAFARAYHATHDHPKIFDDFLADALFSEQERTEFGHNLATALQFYDPERAAQAPDEASALAEYMQRQGGPITLSRSCFAEDCLEQAIQSGVRQYVVLGAGFDTFAFRRADLLIDQRVNLQVFELDHPATQASKRARLAQQGLTAPAQLHFIPADFAKDNLVHALEHSSFDASKTAFFSWLGVTYYLSAPVVLETLRAIATFAAAGSEIVFDYMDSQAFHPTRAAFRMQRMHEMVRRIGEPMQAYFEPAQLGAQLSGIGLSLRENLGPIEIERRFFRNRADGYHAFEHVHFARARVAGKP